jgi:hypothetical protein
VIIVTPAVSVSFFRPEFNDFLYASIGAEGNEMPLSVLSALSRLNVDPWEEAAKLSELPKDTATQRLASLIARLPAGRWTQADCTTIAHRLVELLPHRSRSGVPLVEEARGARPEMTRSAGLKVLICTLVGATALVIAASCEPSTRSDTAEIPTLSRASSSLSQ